MGRAWRIEYEGALYHLMSRGNDGQYIYLNDNALSQQKQLAKDIKLDDLLKKSAKIVQIDLDK